MHPRSDSVRQRDPRARRRPSKQVVRQRAIAVLFAASAVGFTVFLFFISSLGHSVYGRSVPHSTLRNAALLQSLRSAALAERGKASYGLPVRLMIPRLGIDAAVEDVGLTADGAMGVPSSPKTVAWFKLGPHPGDKGSAVIAGHSGYRNGAAVFDDLSNLRKGDLLFVEDAKGVPAEFVVRGSRTYDRDANASDVFGRNEGRHLNLITCTGPWDAAAGTHDERLVVFTDAVR